MKLLKNFLAFAVVTKLAFGHYTAFAQTAFWEQTDGPPQAFSLVVNSNGHIFASSNFGGVFRSLDNGDTWTTITNGLTSIHVFSMAINSSGHIFVTTYYASGVFRSIDNGDSWAPFSKGLPEYFYGGSLAVGSSGYVFVSGSSALGSSGVFRSSDTSDDWTLANNGLTSRGVLAINSNGHIFAGTNGGMVFRSLDNGDHWTPVSTDLMKSSVRCININATGQILVGTESNWIFRSIDNGGTWSALNATTYPTVYALATNSDGHIFAGTSPVGVFRSIDNGNSWTQINDGLTNTWVTSLAINSNGKIFAGTFVNVFRSVQTTTAVDAMENDDERPSSFAVSQNFPNPFNPSTKISFALPSVQNATLKIFNLAGQEVATLLNNERRPAGNHELTFDAGDLPSGVYFYQLRAGEFTETKKMLLVR